MRRGEYAYCHGRLQAWTLVRLGMYRCVCCGHQKKLVDTRWPLLWAAA